MRQVAESIELADALSAVDVSPEEYTRLLGYPRGWVLEGRARELAVWARDWYAKNGRPWFYARQAESMEIGGIDEDAMRPDRSDLARSNLTALLSTANVCALRSSKLERTAQFWWPLAQARKPRNTHGTVGAKTGPTNISSSKCLLPQWLNT